MIVQCEAWYTPRGVDAKVFKTDTRSAKAVAARFISARIEDKTILRVRHEHGRCIVSFANIATHEKDGRDRRSLKNAKAPAGFVDRKTRRY